ncbi:TrbC/VirB2 family protein [Orientia tsutsugamushi]|uniref:TrbC/VirB2 family protein n=1 Tax=Orientia tsutsugamushi TaxID=784 RepID=UPI00315D0868
MRLLSFKQNCYLKPLLILCFLMLLLSSSIVSANGNTDNNDVIGNKLCEIVGIMSGKTAKAICLVAIMFLGVTTFMGKVNWSTAMITVSAIIIITQSSKVYDFIAKDSTNSSTQCNTTSSS